ncbi:hypothetical protein BKA61DRAFT_250766 [Leptodontidium sp. MPI-SDFR-AT-0119]|nr:hypothetical protein BKA61DRAFT_250766 [Leptodontidium sp. MPI-SDFR-AT-0119]
MGDITRNYTPENQLQALLRTWIYITEVLVTNGYSACLLKEFSSIASGQVDQARVSSIATPPASSIAETARSEGLRTPAILSLITNHQTCDDASSLSLGHNGDRNVATGSDDCHPANVYSKWMSRSNVEDRADTVTDDEVEDELNYSNVDDPSGVPPYLISNSACLSQYHSRSPAQVYEDTLATEETTSQSSSRVNSCALTQISPLRGPSHRRESQSLPMSRSTMSHNTTSTDPPIIYTIPVSTAGLGNSSLDTDQSDDAPRSELYHPRSCI